MKTNKNKNSPNGDLILLGGEILFHEYDKNSAYHLLLGEVVMLRNGQVVDLVEAGELINADMWQGVTAIAWTDCVIQTLALPTPPTDVDLHPSVIDRHLALAA